MTHDWSDADKAQWYLEHGYPEIRWVRERVGDQVFKRPTNHKDGILPPWLDRNERYLDYIWKDNT